MYIATGISNNFNKTYPILYVFNTEKPMYLESLALYIVVDAIKKQNIIIHGLYLEKPTIAEAKDAKAVKYMAGINNNVIYFSQNVSDKLMKICQNNLNYDINQLINK